MPEATGSSNHPVSGLTRKKRIIIGILVCLIALVIVGCWNAIIAISQMAEVTNRLNARMILNVDIRSYAVEHPEVHDIPLVAAVHEFGDDSTLEKVATMAGGTNWQKNIVIIRQGSSLTISYGTDIVTDTVPAP